MANNSPPRYLSVQGISTTNGGQTYAGNFFDCVWGSKSPDADKEAAIDCRNALFLTDPYVDRERLISAKGTRVPGTCEWIVYHESYRAWLSDNGITRPLWISGGPGKGKTMMYVFLTEELERHVKPMHNTDLVFFFCTAGNEECNTAVTVLRGLVHQIITKRPQLVKHALEHFKTPKRTKQTLSSLETLWIIFSKLVADDELGTMFCVLDGLDECQENGVRHLISRLVRLFKNNLLSTKSKFKLAIISRNLPGLKDCIQIKLDPDNDEKVGSDINLFVSARLDELSEIGGFDSIRADIQETLLNRAQGTFLWVGFAMYELLQKQTCSEIYETLQDLPSGLPAIYSRMLLQIPAGKRKISQTILQ